MKLKAIVMISIAVMLLCSGCSESKFYKAGYKQGYSEASTQSISAIGNYGLEASIVMIYDSSSPKCET